MAFRSTHAAIGRCLRCETASVAAAVRGGSDSGQRFKHARQVTLVGKSGVTGDLTERGARVAETPADVLNAQAGDVVSDRAPAAPPKGSGKMRRMNVHVGRERGKLQAIRKALLNCGEYVAQPGRLGGVVVLHAGNMRAEFVQERLDDERRRRPAVAVFVV